MSADKPVQMASASHWMCLSLDEWAEVERLIQEDLSPEQAANRLELEGCLQISHEIIYQHIYADKRNGGGLYRH